MPQQIEPGGGKPRVEPGPAIGEDSPSKPWMFAALVAFCVAVIAAVWLTGSLPDPMARAAGPVYRDKCPPEFPLQVTITYDTVCIAGVKPTRERVQ